MEATRARAVPPNAMNITTGQLFDNPRPHNGFTAEPISDATLKQLYELMKWGPTSANSSPARVVVVRSPQAKAKLLETVSAGSHDKTKQPPVTAIIATDIELYQQLPKLFPHAD